VAGSGRRVAATAPLGPSATVLAAPRARPVQGAAVARVYDARVRRLFGWTAGLVGIAALARLLARRQVRATRAPSPAVDPADELRRKLDESRAHAPAGVSPGGPAEGAHQDEPAAPTETLDERRARVHAKAQEALEAMEALQEPPA
jgi:hypothetical protein